MFSINHINCPLRHREVTRLTPGRARHSLSSNPVLNPLSFFCSSKQGPSCPFGLSAAHWNRLGNLTNSCHLDPPQEHPTSLGGVQPERWDFKFLVRSQVQVTLVSARPGCMCVPVTRGRPEWCLWGEGAWPLYSRDTHCTC